MARAETIVREVGVPVTVEWLEDSIHDIPRQRAARLAPTIQAFIAALSAHGEDRR